MIVNVRIFEVNNSVKEVSITSSQQQLTIKQIKQILQAHLSLLGKKMFMTTPGFPTLYDDNDVINNKEGAILIIGYAKSYQQSLSFRVSSARARNYKVDKINIVVDF